MRIFTASLATETNTFSAVPTDRASFAMAFHAPPGKHPETPTLCSSPMLVLRRLAREDKLLEVIEGTAAWAEPGGLLNREAYEHFRDTILAEIKAALPVDGVVLGLHGAMVAQGYDDCEGDLLERVRKLVGPKTIIAAELDPHSHLTPKRVAHADILAAFLEFPHTDFYERAEHVVDLALRAIAQEIRPVLSTFDCRMIDVYPTSREPMRSFVERMKELHGKDGILSVSFIHGFMAADVPEMGSRMLVVSDGDKAKGDRLAEKLGREMFSLRGKTMMPTMNIDDGLDRALAVTKPGKPAVIADMWDNPGGGVAGDGTLILRRMIERRIGKAAFATIWDPLAVSFARGAGEGAEIDLRIGGKSGPLGGEPIDARVLIRKVTQEGWQSFGQSRVTLGPAAVVQIAGSEIDVILNTNRTQTFEPDIFANLGIDPLQQPLLVVKSTNHFHAGFAPIASDIIYVAAGNTYPNNPKVTNYRKLTRKIWPRVEDPFG
jgi:microcystin degradation protein MlrC